MGKVKQQRLAEQIRQTLSILFLQELHDPRLDGITVTDVTIDREFQYADIFIHALGEDERQADVLEALQRASGFLRRELSRTLRIRSAPVLHFHWDPLLAQAERINDLLDSLDIPPEPPPDAPADTEPSDA